MPKEEYIKYYEKVLGLSPEDFSRFQECICRRLAYSFRIARSPFIATIRKRLQRYPFLKKIECLEDVYTFYKDVEKDLYGEFISFLVKQTTIGLIQRQEIVSMLPIALLDIKKDSKVLDMCAAPGSKTKQILEIVTDEGLVVANDQNGKRLNILVTETSKRPNSSLIITKHDASLFPKIYIDEQIAFDRILCDVPCSSDGTVRKNPNILSEWDAVKNTGLFNIQCKILKRGCELLKKDGLIAYSTCSLNPIENECVVQKILLGGGFEVVDFRNDPRLSLFGVDHEMKGVIFREGLTKWEVDHCVTENTEHQPVEEDLGLEKCIRLYPHDQDTGGFFIAILRRKDIKSSETKGKVKTSTRFHFLPNEMQERLFSTYSIQTSGVLYTKSSKHNHIEIVSSISSEVLKRNPCLKVLSAGYRILEKSGLDHSEFYLKNLFYVGSQFKHDLEIPFDKFKILLKQNFVDNKILGFEHVGLAIVKISEIDMTLCGYGSSSSFTIFMSNNLRRGLEDLLIDEHIECSEQRQD